MPGNAAVSGGCLWGRPGGGVVGFLWGTPKIFSGLRKGFGLAWPGIHRPGTPASRTGSRLSRWLASRWLRGFPCPSLISWGEGDPWGRRGDA